MARRTRPRTVPRLANDITRGWVASILPFLAVFLSPLLVMVPGFEYDQTQFTIGIVFVTWAFVSVLTGVFTIVVFTRASSEQLMLWLRATTPRTDRARFISLLNGGGAGSWAVSGSVLAITAVLVLSFNAELRSDPFIVFPGIAVVVFSIFMTVTAYAVKYAREFAGDGGLSFPGTPAPVFSDFLYFATQVSTTFSPSDVVVEQSRLRRMVTAHSVIAFAFNTVIVALLVSVLISAATA